MNERIKNLMIEAGKTIPGDKQIDADFCEKFAELLVKECDRYVAEHYDECEPWMEPGDLLKHFGVE